MSLGSFTSTDPLAQLAVTQWDRTFLSNPDYRKWLQQELQSNPIHSNEPLAEYIDRRTRQFSSSSSSILAQPFEQNTVATHAGSVAPLSFMQPSHPLPQESTATTSPLDALDSSAPLAINPVMMLQSQSNFSASPLKPASAARQVPPPQPSKSLLVRSKKVNASSPGPASPLTANVDSPDANSPAPPVSAEEQAAAAQAANESWKRIRPQVMLQLEACNSKFVVRSANTLAKCLHPFSDSSSPSTMVPVEGRLEVLNTLLQKATKDFFQALVGAEQGRDVFESWCNDAVMAGRKGTYNKAILDTLKPCLLLLKRMPYKFDEVSKSKLALPKALSGVVKREAYSPECRELAQQLVNNWREIVRTRQQAQAKQEDAKRKIEAANLEDARKKRKISPPPGPAPKITTTTPAPSASKQTLNNLLGSKSGTGALKNLSIGKGGAALPTPTSTNTNPKLSGFASILASLSGSSSSKDISSNSNAQKPSPGPTASGVSANSAQGSSSGAKQSTGLLKRPGSNNFKKKKSVRWKEDDELEAIREIERAVYEDDHNEESLDLRVMEANEGKVMSHRTDEEPRPWVQPLALNLPDEAQMILYPPQEPLFPLGQAEAVARQSEDTSAMELEYDPDDLDVPDTPMEPPEEDPYSMATDATCKQMSNAESMVLDPSYRETYARAHPSLTDVIRSSAVNDLLQQMQRTQAQEFARPPPQAQPSYPYPQNHDYVNNRAYLDASRPQVPTAPARDRFTAPPPPPSAGAITNNSRPAIGRQERDSRVPTGPRHHNYKKTPCVFYAQGTCFKGDNCSFIH